MSTIDPPLLYPFAFHLSRFSSFSGTLVSPRNHSWRPPTGFIVGRKTLVIDRENDDPLFSLLDHVISLAVHDDTFEAKSARKVENMFWAKVPSGRKSLILKWKRDALDLPVFREKSRGVGGRGTSPTDPLRASTWIGYLKRLGEKAGFQHSFTQYGLRRGLLNVVNSTSAPLRPVVSIR